MYCVFVNFIQDNINTYLKKTEITKIKDIIYSLQCFSHLTDILKSLHSVKNKKLCNNTIPSM